MNFKEPKAYLCDPEKNKECGKQRCFLHGGPCHLTTNPNYRKVISGEKSSKPIIKKKKEEKTDEPSK